MFSTCSHISDFLSHERFYKKKGFCIKLGKSVEPKNKSYIIPFIFSFLLINTNIVPRNSRSQFTRTNIMCMATRGYIELLKVSRKLACVWQLLGKDPKAGYGKHGSWQRLSEFVGVLLELRLGR